MGRTSGLDLRGKGDGPRPVSRRAVRIAGNGGDGAAGGGSRPWMLRFRLILEKIGEIAIWGSPGRWGSPAAGNADTKFGKQYKRMRSPKSRKCGHEVRNADADTKSGKKQMRTQSPKSSKCEHEIRKAVNVDTRFEM
ncbi:hypothetical protein CRG98_014509 [Punica granatum]|uniref:Uncharacterized protein n=1 Tax=Punica granatum TaxID=22663 RepID=A0A2I0KA41_PUNGR|nr:hypothetical protein CRG98_014509 [Punica granatum]